MAISRLPILPLEHPVIVLPASRFTLHLSKELGEAVMALIEQSDALPIVAAVPIINPTSSTEAPVLADWGTATRILRLIKPPARNPRQPYMVSLSGLTRVRLPTPLKLDHSDIRDSVLGPTLLTHDIEYQPTEKVPSKEVAEKFKQSAVRLLDRLAREAVQMSRREGFQKIADMLDDIADARTPWMADVLIATIGTEYSDKLAILSCADSEARLNLAHDIFIKQASISEVTQKIASAVDESLSKQQKEFFLRQQMAAIQRELQALRSSSSSSSPRDGSADRSTGSELDDDEQQDADDLLYLRRKIEAMEPGSEERKMGVREFKRLKRIPQGSVENGVIRSYLEWLTSLPWPNSTTDGANGGTRSITDRNFLSNAREQLDADHFGLEKIKKRLIEYLAVVRLKEMNAERERPESQKLRHLSSETATSETKVANDDATNEKALVPYKPSSNPEPRPQLQRRAKGVKGPILLFVGPPGTGKTSLGQSIAKALDRPFQRISLGGVRDEAEIRGHRRTYVASGPGLIVQALRKAGRPDFVLLLDEIDKIGQSNFHGDPGAALLEVLDPEQNHTFNDHYINIPVDLSQILFICTSNTLDTISAPLLDRCEIIQLSGYTYIEKLAISKRFLLPKQLKANGLDESHVTITEPALLHIATRYTHEAGVRSLERAIGSVVRFKAVQWAEYVDAGEQDASLNGLEVVSIGQKYQNVVEEHELETILGISRWDEEEAEREERIGVVYGLVVMGRGEGGILPVETVAVPGIGGLKLTGSLGEVIKESGELALSWVKRHSYDLCITNTQSQDPLKFPDPIDIHLHLPAGAQKKDGPSAGIAMVCAFVSLLTGARVPSNVAMTGELTLRGRVTPVGGIKEKVLGAHRAHITKVILPWANRKDVEHDVALEIRNEMQFVFVRTVHEALQAAFGENALAWRRDSMIIESRL
ncbi:ATP-dependent protease La [Mycena floridula]|nr:ATP-dependent protease La [Mycena floridula]